LIADEFSNVVDRRNSDSTKWGDADRLFGAEGVLPMWVADMDFISPPQILDALRKRVEHGVFGYPSPRTYAYDVLAEWLTKRQGWQVKPSWLVSTPGVVTALSLAVQTFTQPGDKIIVQPPVYPPFFSCIADNGRLLVENPLLYVDGGYQMDFDDLARKARGAKMLILCSPHNPVGRVWTRAELVTLAKICVDNDLLILADEIHGDLIYEGHRHTPLASLDASIQNNTITCIAASKTFNTAGLYTSTVIIPEATLCKQFTKAVQTLGIAKSNIFGIAAFEAAYKYGGPWLDQLLIYLQDNATYLTKFIAQEIPALTVSNPEGTYLTWLDCRSLGLNSEDLANFFAQKAKVGLNNGVTFGEQGAGFMRLNFGCPRPILTEGLNRIARAITEFVPQ
jgi:cystathionine beta-lyase